MRGEEIQKNEKHLSNISMYEGTKAVEHYSRLEGLTLIEKKIVEEFFKGSVLDLGCGCGRTTRVLADKGFEVIGADNSCAMIEEAKKISPKVRFVVGDACNLQFERDSFDTVFFSFNGIDYIFPSKKRIVALQEISRVLKPSGILVFSSHNPLPLIMRFRPMFLLRNLIGKTLFSEYKIEKDTYGIFHTFYARPSRQKRIVEQNTNLKFKRLIKKGVVDLFPHYVFQKV